MITIDIFDALVKQIEFCKKENNYMCGIYVNSEGNKNTVLNMIYFLTRHDTKVKIKNNTCESFVGFDDRSFIKIIKANNYARGHRFNGMIIDSQISKEIVNTNVLPKLVPLRANDNIFYTDDKPMDRVFFCHIDKTSYSILNYFCNSNTDSDKQIIDIKNWTKNKKSSKLWTKFKMELYGGNSNMEDLIYHDHPVVEKDLNGYKVLLYEAWGIPKCLIEYSTEFINKTKETYLNIVGKFENESIGFENDINVHLKIDTDIYDGYEVHIEDGLITVSLHEIENEVPVLKDYGVA